jgi:hypothetical protein
MYRKVTLVVTGLYYAVYMYTTHSKVLSQNKLINNVNNIVDAFSHH